MRLRELRVSAEMHAVLARLAGKNVRASDAVENAGNLDQNVAGVAVGLLQIARELGAKMADQARREAAGKCKRSRFRWRPVLRRCR